MFLGSMIFLNAQENQERSYYIEKNFPKKELNHNGNLIITAPYNTDADRNGPYSFSFKVSNLSIDIIEEIKNAIDNKENIESVAVVKVKNDYQFNLISLVPIENKKWAAGFYYSIGFEYAIINGLKTDIINYVRSIRHKNKVQ